MCRRLAASGRHLRGDRLGVGNRAGGHGDDRIGGSQRVDQSASDTPACAGNERHTTGKRK